MPELSISNIEQITRDIGMQDVNFSHLLDDLVDHVCCDVEEEMCKGCDFNEAYRRVLRKIAPDRFREIQKETLYAVDKKYRIMKNTMKISGIAGTVIFGIAAIFKIQHWPGAGIMMTLGAFLLALVFLPSALGVLWKETHSKGKIFLFISAFLTGFFFIVGTLFKTQHWLFAGYMLTFSVFSAVFLFVPSLLYRYLRNPDKKHLHAAYILGSAGFVIYVAGLLFKIQHWPLSLLLIVTGTFILGFIALPLYTFRVWKNEIHLTPKFLFMIIALVIIIVPGAIVNLNVQYSYEDGYYPYQFSQVALHEYLVKRTDSMMDQVHDSTKYRKIADIHTEAEKLLVKVGDLQSKMVRESESRKGIPAEAGDQLQQTGTGLKVNYYYLSKPFHLAPVKDYLSPGTASRQELESGLAVYLRKLSSYLPPEKTKEYNSMLDPSNFLPVSTENGESMMSGLHSLELLRNCILAIESGAVKYIANN